MEAQDTYMNKVLWVIREPKHPQLVNNGIVDASKMRYVMLGIGAKNPSVQHRDEGQERDVKHSSCQKNTLLEERVVPIGDEPMPGILTGVQLNPVVHRSCDCIPHEVRLYLEVAQVVPL
jgi:hypothetical protein